MRFDLGYGVFIQQGVFWKRQNEFGLSNVFCLGFSFGNISAIIYLLDKKHIMLEQEF
jgi:hypothetical protein